MQFKIYLGLGLRLLLPCQIYRHWGSYGTEALASCTDRRFINQTNTVWARTQGLGTKSLGGFWLSVGVHL